jgi:hypothetical protein
LYLYITNDDGFPLEIENAITNGHALAESSFISTHRISTAV